MNRRKKLALNTITALICQIATLICGFILPRYILSYFGSETNGLINSITRFLAVISFLELGIGPVIQSNLYKPLAQKDNDTLSKIIVSAERFYRRIAYIFVVYIFLLSFVFPSLTVGFDTWYTVSLLIIISISTFAQYFFGITYQVFLNADQKVYVPTTLQIITVVANTIISVVLMRLGCSIQVVKLGSAFVFLLRPLAQNLYVKKHYCIDKTIQYTQDPIQQKWNGFAQHLAAVVCAEIDVILLTLFASYQSVSIYSVYFLVVSGIHKIVMTLVTGLESFWGNMIAKEEYGLLNKTFASVECYIHMGVTVLFAVTAICITPFIQVYTKGLADSQQYIMPLFGIILTTAYAIQCLRVPYFRMIKAVGHYKETQNGAFISMAINIVVSVVLVFRYQLIGVALGTLLAMLYHTIYFAWYLRKKIINRQFRHFAKHLLLDVVICLAGYMCTAGFRMENISYLSWFMYALWVTIIVGMIALVLNVIFYRAEILFLIHGLFKKKK